MVDLQQNPEMWKQLSTILDPADLKAFQYCKVPQSFYQPLPATAKGKLLDMSYSSFSVHWTSRVWCELKDHCTCINLPSDSPEWTIWEKGAESDWRTFLTCSAAELKPGGLLFVSQVPPCCRMNRVRFFEYPAHITRPSLHSSSLSVQLSSSRSLSCDLRHPAGLHTAAVEYVTAAFILNRPSYSV
jgi:hypothetical protein